jgi:uncharacterized protein
MSEPVSDHRSFSATLHRIGAVIVRAPGGLLIAMVGLYRWTLGPMLRWTIGPQCRYEPTCSRYFIESVRKCGAWRGAFRGVKRICRCHPWNPGGYDPP